MLTHFDPYITCPTYETPHFHLRLIREEDAADLLECYADPAAAPIFNSDNCTSDFVYHTLEEMQSAVRFWVDSYLWKYFVRFAIVDREREKAIGTIEFFARPDTHPAYGVPGVLRLDLASRYETAARIAEILAVVDAEFYPVFGVDSIITKAIPAAVERIAALEQAGYRAMKPKEVMPYDDYFVRMG